MKNKEKKNNKKVKFAIIFSTISALVLTILLVILIPYGNMRKGISLINSGKYEDASNVLDGNYLNSAKKMKALAEAGVSFNKGNYKEGTRLITSNGGSVLVNYDFDGGEGSKEHEIIKGNTNIRILPTYDGYKFNGYDITDFQINSKAYSATLELKATWVGKEYDVSIFYQDYGCYYGRTITLTYGEPYDINPDVGNGRKIAYWKDLDSERTIPSTGIWSYTDIDRMEACAVWDIFELGSYPQSKVTNFEITNSLNELAGNLPSSSNSYSWTSYKYYQNKVVSDYYWYIDVAHQGKKYRGVYFSDLRSSSLLYEKSFTNYYHDNFSTNTVYWFEFEPIKWICFKYNGLPYLMTEKVLDCTQYATYFNNPNTDQTLTHYSRSNIRTWLNDNFYNLAFSEQEKEMILTTTVNNSVDERYNKSDEFACSTTYDKVFISSAPELDELIRGNTHTKSYGSDYAYCQGLYGETNSGVMYATYRLRTPYDINGSYCVNYSGYISSNCGLNATNYGVRPCITITR